MTEILTHGVQAITGNTAFTLFAYALSAGAFWLFFSVIFHVKLKHRKVNSKGATRNQITREILHSLRSLVIYGLVTTLVIYAASQGWTQLYFRIGRFGWGWFFTSIVLMIILHDAYFYWTHRLIHHPRLYRLVHHTHHLSTTPTPWAAYAFSPLEAMVQAGIGPLIVFTMPTHPLAFTIFMSWQIGFNVFGHCGYEIYPRWFIRSPLALFINTVTHHSLHHEKFRGNYGLYFNIWDRIMGTNRTENDSRFEKATGNPQQVGGANG